MTEQGRVVRVGVVGTGSIGADHVERLSGAVQGARVTAVFDVVPERAQQVATRAAGTWTGTGSAVTVHAGWEDVVTDDAVDAVVIASPGELHVEQTLACLAAGKPVLCEKPLATNADDALRVLDAETALGRRLVTVGFMRRFDPAYVTLRQAVDARAVGEPLLAHALHRNASVPDFFVGEMALTDSVVHEIDISRWLFAEEVSAVTVVPVRQSPLANVRLRDPQVVVLELAGGQVVTVESFLNAQYAYDVQCEVVGSTGTLRLDSPRTADWRERFADAYLAELTAWVSAVAAGGPAGPDSALLAGAASVWDGYVASACAAAAVHSAREGGRVEVALVEKPELYR